jgi:hypothetical protein
VILGLFLEQPAQREQIWLLAELGETFFYREKGDAFYLNSPHFKTINTFGK